MEKVLYMECKTGAAGDMLMGALYSLLSEEQKAEFLEKINHITDEVCVTPQEVCKQGIGGIHMCVRINGREEDEATAMEEHHAHAPHDSEHEHPHPHDDGHMQDENAHCQASLNDHSLVHDHGDVSDHVHQHTHDHEHTHEHDHSHMHADHEHDHEHTHEHDHSHDHLHHHEHDHEHTHLHHHDHDHMHTHEHSHDHAHGHSHGHHAHTSVAAILERISTLDLSDGVKKSAQEIYRMIAAAESKVHRTSVDQIHFHEVGSVDALIDVVGSCLAIEMLDVDKISCSPVCVGNGTVRCAHGVLPVPAPATAEIIRGMPVYASCFDGELLTPTGAAILKYFSQEFTRRMEMTIEDIGYGFGTKEFAQLSCVRAFLGKRTV